MSSVITNLNKFVEKYQLPSIRSSSTIKKYPLNKTLKVIKMDSYDLITKKKKQEKRMSLNEYIRNKAGSKNIKENSNLPQIHTEVIREQDEGKEILAQSKIKESESSFDNFGEKENNYSEKKETLHEILPLIHNFKSLSDKKIVLSLNIDSEINKEYLNKPLFKPEKKNNFCLSIDGSAHCEFAFDILTKEFLDQNSLFLMVYVFNSKFDKDYNFNNKKSSVIQNYNFKSIKINKTFHQEELVGHHHIIQVYKQACIFKSNYLMIGKSGLSGPRGDLNMYLSGLKYLLIESKIPVLLIQEQIARDSKQGFKWLFLFDRKYLQSKKILDTFVNLVDKEKDTIQGVNFMPNYIYYDDLKEDFEISMKKFSIKNYTYENIIDKENSFITQVNSLVNHGDTNFDFVVFYHNVEKYKLNPDKSDSNYLISKLKCNLCFTV